MFCKFCLIFFFWGDFGSLSNFKSYIECEKESYLRGFCSKLYGVKIVYLVRLIIEVIIVVIFSVSCICLVIKLINIYNGVENFV